jgi:hypothetical protein
MIESAFVTWLGILILEITSLAPTGHVTVRSHVPQTAGRTKRRWTDEPRCWIRHVGHHTHILRKRDVLCLRLRVLFSILFCLGHLAEPDYCSSGPVKGDRNFGH